MMARFLTTLVTLLLIVLTVTAAKKKNDCESAADFFHKSKCSEGICEMTASKKCNAKTKFLVQNCGFSIDCKDDDNIFDLIGDAAGHIVHGTGQVLHDTANFVGDVVQCTPHWWRCS